MIDFKKEYTDSTEVLLFTYSLLEDKLISYDETGIFEKYTTILGEEKTEILKGHTQSISILKNYHLILTASFKNP
ncbi:MAG: hypothetical protein WCQ53_05210 [bacterium]